MKRQFAGKNSGGRTARAPRETRLAGVGTPAPNGFSLLEVILALVVVGLIMSVLGVALIGSLRMEKAARAAMAPDAREEAFLAQWRDDLTAMAKPAGTLTAPFTLTHAEVNGRRADTLTFRTCGPVPLHPAVAARAPDAGLTEVSWAPVANADPKQGLSWVRTRQIHLLATGTKPAAESVTELEGLAECQVQVWSGGAYADDYDSDQLGAVLPKLVRLKFAYLRPDGTAGPSRVMVLSLPQVDMDPTQLTGGTP